MALDAVEPVERGEHVHERMLALQSWEALAPVMMRERYRLLRHLHAHPEPSVSALARALGRQYRRVHEDVTVLEGPGCWPAPPGPCGPRPARSRRKSGFSRIGNGKPGQPR